MTKNFAEAMRQATLSTRAQNVVEATRIIQDALAERKRPDPSAAHVEKIAPPPHSLRCRRLIEPDAEIIEPSSEPANPSASSGTFGTTAGGMGVGNDGLRISPRLRMSLRDVVRALREGRAATGIDGPLPGIVRPEPKTPSIPDGAQFLTRSFTCEAGTRGYRLYVPSSSPATPRGVVVMLHGCMQTPDDFAIGTNMNTVAEANGLLVAYPAQTRSDNASSCWSWFKPCDQRRDAGEPAIIAGLTREIASEFGIEHSRVFVAGLSAGGAMAAVMGEIYPDLYAAIGVHSGLAFGSANDVVSAFAAMRGDVGLSACAAPRSATEWPAAPRTIVFHGSADRTVHPSNADRIIGAAYAHATSDQSWSEHGASGNGRSFTRTVVDAPDGTPAIELWLIDGAGHAWSGGHPDGSYTDPRGPNASAEMVRFFLNHS
jgi:poly(hydroxyalkanoate) depolymerase family esterase